MKKFRFTLETVLKLRKKNEELKLKSLSEVVGRINQFNRDIQKNESDIENYNNAFIDYMGESSSLNHYTVHQSFLKRLHTENENYRKNIADESENLDYARNEYIEASKQRKILELLKEKRLKEYNDILLKQEAMEMEEFNINQLNAQRKAKKHENQFSGTKIDIDQEDSERGDEIDQRAKSQLDRLQEYLGKPKR